MMGVLRLGTLSSLLSEPLVNGFTTAAAFHVITSQAKNVLGIQIPKHKGAFRIMLSARDICLNIGNTNLTNVYIALACMTFMVIMTELVKPWVSKKCSMPIPAELIAVVGGTLLSYYFHLESSYGIKLVGTIPTGLPIPRAPSLELLRVVAVDSIAIVCINV
jgi:solute carrier family 26 protein